MSSTYHLLNPISPQTDLYPQPITALSFDPLSDTLWTGTNSGSIVARYSAQGIRGVSFPVGGGLAVRDIIATDSNVRAYGLAGNGIGAWGKGGVNKWFYQSSSAVTAFSNNSPNASVFYACTAAQELLAINSQTGDVVRKTSAMSIYSHLVHTHSLLVSGSSDGSVRTHDTRSGNTILHTTTAHLSGVQGLQASGNFIFTIGAGIRQGRPFPDPLVKVYDIRTMRPLPPVPFSGGPSFLDRLPNRSSTIVVTSQEGLVNVVDVSNPSDSEFYQLVTPSYLTSAAVSATGTFMAFGDSDGSIHLLSAAEDGLSMPLNGFEGQPVEWAEAPEPPQDVDWTDSTPLNTIGMPYYNTLLLSSWTPKFVPHNSLYPPPPKIPPQILSTMKTNDNVAYAALPKELKGRRNVVVLETKKAGGRFRSGNKFNDVEPDTPDVEYDPDEVPKPYRKVEIEYSKFGVEDFDFGYYNHTVFSGLETHILNSYTNSMVQLLHYTHPIRQLAKSHITTDCARENCLFCELGFVARMLEDARGVNCQSSNFCKTVGVLAHGVNLIEIVDYGRESSNTNHAHMIQSFHRFLVDNLTSEVNAAVYTPEALKFWQDGRNSTFMKPTVELSGEVMGVEDHQSALYELRGMVVQVVDRDRRSHLVAIIKVPEADATDPSPWYLFNDFRVQNISEEEALSFSGSWKVPTVLYLERVDVRSRMDYGELPTDVDLSILSQDTSISRNRDANQIKHDLLQYEELPRPGALVAIDAEFVSMQQEETEYRSDGTKKVLRPARLSLARVSVLRGDGPKEGIPFIDDHIHTSEIIVDYLTEFSGIKYGDLDPLMSRYTLTPLKIVYKKLRLLVDRGCIFVGHGLSKDFRIINIYVPPDQIIDTVDLYFIASRQRRLSLRFLTWYVLKENIQTDTHDSIEDALSALRLFKAYQQFESEGVFDLKLEELYREGRSVNFKPPLLQDSIPKAPGSHPSLSQPYPLSAPMHGSNTPFGHTPSPFNVLSNMQQNQQMFLLQQGIHNLQMFQQQQTQPPQQSNWRSR
ncbi:poly(A)-specific ribonuclease [Steccherinum ochraceum]|uniref:Poly(A)-specific ribonuclease n=1 Tax=Steccherinum ochraceum TaxID=92696 RepID=A0A4R0RX99_9APHY|nr:poly(A)-specific ribonuclease [Steccherinum ochraceum]